MEEKMLEIMRENDRLRKENVFLSAELNNSKCTIKMYEAGIKTYEDMVYSMENLIKTGKKTVAKMMADEKRLFKKKKRIPGKSPDLIIESDHEEDKKLDDLHDYKLKIKNIIETLLNKKIVKKDLMEITKLTKKLMPKVEYDEYLEFIKELYDLLGNLFKEKSLADPKMKLIKNAFSALDCRLLKIHDYNNTKLSMDDVWNLRECIKHTFRFQNEYIPFNQSDLLKKFSNYSLNIVPIKELLSMFMLNTHGKHNIVYMDIRKKKTDDMSDLFRFYYLDRVENDKKYWVLDCRLNNLSTNLCTDIRRYALDQFHKLYYDTFKDNNYRKNFLEMSESVSDELVNLLDTIMILSHPKKFNKYVLRPLIKAKAMIKKTENDEIDFSSDNDVIKLYFKNTEEDIDYVQILTSLFDDNTMSDADARDLYIEKNIEDRFFKR